MVYFKSVILLNLFAILSSLSLQWFFFTSYILTYCGIDNMYVNIHFFFKLLPHLNFLFKLLH